MKTSAGRRNTRPGRRRRRLLRKVAAVVDYVRDLMQAVDQRLVKVREQAQAEGAPVTCRGVGCTACCYDVASINSAEVLFMLEGYVVLPVETKAIIASQFRRWFEVHEREKSLIGPITMERVKKGGSYIHLRTLNQHLVSLTERVPCPFLVSDRCSVYEHRPFACRGHLSTTDPENCWVPGAATLVRDDGMIELVFNAWSSAGVPAEPSASLPEMFRHVCGDSIYEVAGG